MDVLKSHFTVIKPEGASCVYLPSAGVGTDATCKYLPVTVLRPLSGDKPLPFVDSTNPNVSIEFTSSVLELGLAPADASGRCYLLERRKTDDKWRVVAVTQRDLSAGGTGNIRCQMLSKVCTPGRERETHNRDSKADTLSLQIMRGMGQSEGQTGVAAAEQLRYAVKHTDFQNPYKLISVIQAQGKAMQRRCPTEYMVVNVTLRVLHAVRHNWIKIFSRRGTTQRSEAELAFGTMTMDAFLDDSLNSSTPQSVTPPPSPKLSQDVQPGSRVLRVTEMGMGSGMQNFLEMKLSDAEKADLRADVLTFIDDLCGELNGAVDNMATQGRVHVRSGDCLLLHGYSNTVLKFVTAAWRKTCHFDVFVAQDAPLCTGERMAKELVEAGIPATLISDAAVYAVMPRATKVVTGVRAIMADGGAVGHAGIKAVALAAKRYGKPFLVCSSIVKLTPFFPYDMEKIASLSDPNAVLPYSDYENMDGIQVLNPTYDYVPPDLISLLITDDGPYAPSFIYRLLNNYYDPEDYQYDMSLCSLV